MFYNEFRENLIGKRVSLPSETDWFGAESVTYTDGILLVQQTNWDPNCRFELPLTVTDGVITDVDHPTVYETVYYGEYAEAEDEEERAPEADDLDYLYEMISEYFPQEGEEQ